MSMASCWAARPTRTRAIAGGRPCFFGEATPYLDEGRVGGDAALCREGAGVGRAAELAHAAFRGPFHGAPGARAFRRHLSENTPTRRRHEVLRDAVALVEDRAAAPIAA